MTTHSSQEETLAGGVPNVRMVSTSIECIETPERLKKKPTGQPVDTHGPDPGGPARDSGTAEVLVGRGTQATPQQGLAADTLSLHFEMLSCLRLKFLGPPVQIAVLKYESKNGQIIVQWWLITCRRRFLLNY